MANVDNANAEVRFSIDANLLRTLQQRLGVERSTDIARSALTLLDWASREAANGRVILSTTDDGKDVHRLVMPELSQAARK